MANESGASAPNWQDCGPLLIEALEAQIRVDELTAKLSHAGTTDAMEIMEHLRPAKAKALRLRDAALARAKADHIDAMVDHARGCKAS